MDLTPIQEVEILHEEIKLLEFGKRHYNNNRFYRGADILHTIHMKKYDDRIQLKREMIKKIEKKNDSN